MKQGFAAFCARQAVRFSLPILDCVLLLGRFKIEGDRCRGWMDSRPVAFAMVKTTEAKGNRGGPPPAGDRPPANSDRS
jgi:hypothetical protein